MDVPTPIFITTKQKSWLQKVQASLHPNLRSTLFFHSRAPYLKFQAFCDKLNRVELNFLLTNESTFMHKIKVLGKVVEGPAGTI